MLREESPTKNLLKPRQTKTKKYSVKITLVKITRSGKKTGRALCAGRRRF